MFQYEQQPTTAQVLGLLRRAIRAYHPDSFLTDRSLYALFSKHAAVLMRRQDERNKLMKYNSVFQVLYNYPLIQTTRAELLASMDVSYLPPGVEYIARTEKPLPRLHEGYYGPLLRNVSSGDGSQRFEPATQVNLPYQVSRTGHQYNRTKYYYYQDGHLLLPGSTLAGIRIDGVFEGDVKHINENKPYCGRLQDQRCNIPLFLHSEIQQLVIAELAAPIQVPTDTANDMNNPAR